MAAAGAGEILLVPNKTVGPAEILKETAKGWFRPWVKGMAFAGYMRTRERFFELWQNDYVFCREVKAGELIGFLLKRKVMAS